MAGRAIAGPPAATVRLLGMSRIFATAVVVVPLLAQAQTGGAAVLGTAPDGANFVLQVASADPFDLDPTELDPIRYSRIDDPLGAPMPPAGGAPTELSFTLRPRFPDFSREGLYGLGIIGVPSLAVQRVPAGNDELDEAITDLNEGFSYSAGLRVEREAAAIDGTAYVSSSLLGMSYGRLGRLWYGGIDVNLERFDDAAHGADQPDVVSLDVTTGRRLGITGLGSDAPLWLLSVRGDLDLIDVRAGEAAAADEARPSWFLNPSLFWQHPGFTFSAQMQLPVAPELEDSEQPDYRLRAVFEKRFR